MKSQDVLPILISILVIILVAVLEKQSKLIAAITATMPLTAPLAVWIVYSSTGGDQRSMIQFSRGMVLGVLPTVGFLAAVWLAARAGFKLAGMLLIGYAVWAVGLTVLVGIRQFVGL